MKISASTIERIYFKGRVKFKFINKIKKVINFNDDYYKNLFVEMYSKLQMVLTQNIKLIYIDEAVFTFNTCKTKAWSAAYQSISVLESKMR